MLAVCCSTLRQNNVRIRNVDVGGIALNHDAPHVSHRRVKQAIFVSQPALATLADQRAWVIQPGDGVESNVSQARDVCGLPLSQVGSAHVAVKRNVSVGKGVCLQRGGGRHVFEAIGQDVGVVVAPYKRAVLGNRDEACEVGHLALWVAAALFEGAEVEELGAGVHVRPKAVLQDLLGAAQLLVDFEGVEVGEDAHDFGEAVHLQNVQKLKGLHFKAKSSVNEQKDEISNCRRVSAT
jgi:hypothetical protein